MKTLTFRLRQQILVEYKTSEFLSICSFISIHDDDNDEDKKRERNSLQEKEDLISRISSKCSRGGTPQNEDCLERMIFEWRASFEFFFHLHKH